ncbi:hypothetical protein [Polyangium aurulentum]|uniref:hypothetical protein n=1 Tax=Polyangium aurulentum TaxID=2567896 RepID=UPI0010AE82F2|nr:hypothetical protein [Polyangium aurulentum]UQA62580.1 hypothetical protein E8A73_019850 [Polyangium aurulentum]
MRRLGIALFSALAALARPAAAQTELPDAGPVDTQDLGDAGRVWASCVERVPEGARRPEMKEAFPESGLSGYAASLELTIVHGKGETVMPGGFRVQRGSDAEKALEASGFVLPDPDGGAGPSLATEVSEGSATTKVTIPFLLLPEKPGRNGLMLPPMPITLARASGETLTVCTAPHAILVEDPIANELDPQVRPNPEPRPQREDWPLARQVAIGAALVAVLSVIGAWLLSRWARRPKSVYVPPPKLPWIAALEELEAIRKSDLLAEGHSDVYFDRVSDCVRKYLGARYGFDGLESTTDEMQRTLARVRPPVQGLDTISRFLEECDLVKFARVVPGENDCLAALDRGVTIVRNTTPPQKTAAPAPAATRTP